MKSWVDKNYKIGFPKARGDISNIIYPVYADTKLDGELNFVIFENNNAYMVNKDKYGRYRAEFPVIEELKTLGLNNIVMVGELYYGNNVYDFLRNKDNDNVKFAIFDIWELDINNSINKIYKPSDKKPYKERRLWLEQIAKTSFGNFKHTHITTCDLVNNEKELLIKRQNAINKGNEGLITKSPASVWVNADLKSWVKLKREETADLVIMGYCRKAKYLSLLLGYWNNGKLKSLCGCGSGLTMEQKLEYAKMLESDKLPTNRQFDKEYILVNPKYVAEVSYQEKTILNGCVSALRHPVFKRLRTDKTINDVSWK